MVHLVLADNVMVGSERTRIGGDNLEVLGAGTLSPAGTGVWMSVEGAHNIFPVLLSILNSPQEFCIRSRWNPFYAEGTGLGILENPAPLFVRVLATNVAVFGSFFHGRFYNGVINRCTLCASARSRTSGTSARAFALSRAELAAGTRAAASPATGVSDEHRGLAHHDLICAAEGFEYGAALGPKATVLRYSGVTGARGVLPTQSISSTSVSPIVTGSTTRNVTVNWAANTSTAVTGYELQRCTGTATACATSSAWGTILT